VLNSFPHFWLRYNAYRMENARTIRTVWRLVQSPAVIFLAAVVVRLWTICSFLASQPWDYFYQRNEAAHIAWEIATGHGFSSPWPNTAHLPTAQQPPVYPFLLAAIFKLCGVYSYHALWVAIAFNVSFAGLTAVILVRIGKSIFGPVMGPWAGLLAAWFWSCSLLEAAASVRLWESSLSALLLIVVLALLFELKDSSRIWGWIILGLVAGVAALTNTSLLALFPFFWLWLWYVHRRRGESSHRRLWASIVFCCLVISPWMIRNYAVFHRVIPIRDNFGLELWVGNGHDTDFSILNVAEFNQLGEIPFMEAKRDRALHFIRTHPAGFMRAMAWRSLRYWTAPEGSAWPWISLLSWAGLFLALEREQLDAAPFAIVMVVFPIVYYVTHSHVTYRYPIEPEILLLAAYTVVRLAEAVGRFLNVEHRLDGLRASGI
jgi:4-amino-4-deoxy-L-arabinose transferase-like glycosyltransferase